MTQQTSHPELFDKQVRRYIYEYFVEHRQAPSVLQCALALASDVSLMQSWYHDRMEFDWRRKTLEEVDALWAELGFTTPFWDLKS